MIHVRFNEHLLCLFACKKPTSLLIMKYLLAYCHLRSYSEDCNIYQDKYSPFQLMAAGTDTECQKSLLQTCFAL